MPPERNPVVKDATTVEDLMGDGPGPDAIDPQAVFMEAVQNDNNPFPDGYEPEAEQAEETPNYEEEVQSPESDGREDAHADAQEGQQEEEVDDESIEINKTDYQRILAMLGIDEEENAQALVEVIKTEKTPKDDGIPKVPTTPLSALEFKLPDNADDLIDTLTDPEKYAAHTNAFVQHVVERTVAAMEPVINERAGYIYQAIEFDKRFFEKHPEVPVKLAVKALATAQKKLGTDASWDDLFVETEKNCAFAMGVAKTMKHADSRANAHRGRNAPQTARTSRPNLNGRQVSPTEEVMQKITSPKDYDAQTVQLLRDIGNM